MFLCVCVFKEFLPAPLRFLPLVILDFSSLTLTKGKETPSPFPLPEPGPLIVSGVDHDERKCFTSDWEKRTSALACTHYIRYRF